MGGLERAPQAPRRSGRPGKPGAVLDSPPRSSRPGKTRAALDSPLPTARPGFPWARLVIPAGARTGEPSSRRHRGRARASPAQSCCCQTGGGSSGGAALAPPDLQQPARGLEDLVEHGARQLAGERVLLAGVIAADEHAAVLERGSRGCARRSAGRREVGLRGRGGPAGRSSSRSVRARSPPARATASATPREGTVGRPSAPPGTACCRAVRSGWPP